MTLRPDPSGQVPAGGRVYRRGALPSTPSTTPVPGAVMAAQEDVAAQAEFLVAHDPTYLLSVPSNLMALCRHFARTGARCPASGRCAPTARCSTRRCGMPAAGCGACP